MTVEQLQAVIETLNEKLAELTMDNEILMEALCAARDDLAAHGLLGRTIT